MNKISHAIAFLILAAAAACAQDPGINPTPTPSDDDSVVKISTNLIQIDVTVTDDKGNPVPDLKPEEVEIYENGEKQKITNFSFVTSIVGRDKNSEAVKTKDKGKDKDQPFLPPAPVRPENVHRTIALVVDDLALSMSEMSATREALRKFVNEQMQDGDLVAILRTGGGIGALQQFTTDKRMLLASIEKVQFNMSGSMRLGTFNPIAPTLNEELNGTKNQQGQTRNRDKDIESEREFENEVNNIRESVFASGSLGAINYVIRGMRELPGRKSIILLSSGIKLFQRNARGLPEPSRIFDSLQRLIDLANRSSVVIYTIDVRGVVFDGPVAEDNMNGLTSEQLEGRLQDRRNELIDTQLGLTYLSKQTGGFPYSLNGIATGIRRAVDDQSYYLVGYEPDDATFDPKRNRFNRLTIKIKRPGTRVRYRSGFFGVSEEQVAAASTKTPGLQKLYNALSSPFSINDISLRMNSLFMTDSKQTYLRSFLHINAKDLSFSSDAPGTHKTTFDLVAATFGDNGVPVDGERKTYTLSLPEDGYQKVLKHGLVYSFNFPVKKPGAYQMRVAIRDTETNRVGSANQFVEVPNLKKNRLTLSGILLEDVALNVWQQLDKMSPEDAKKAVDPQTDTAIRQFGPGTVLTYETNVYNSRVDPAGNRSLTTQAKLFSEQTIVFEGKPVAATSAGEMPVRGSLLLGSALPAGNYTLQVIVTDNNAKEGRKVAFQFVPFEIVR